MNTKTYKPQEFAKVLGISVKTLQRWDRDGILKAHRTITNRRYYTDDQFGDVTEEQQNEGVMERSRSILRASLMTRGDLYVMMRNIPLEHKELNTSEGREFLQQLINKVLELPARWPSAICPGIIMEQNVKLDADLIWNTDVLEIVYKYWDGEPDNLVKGMICKRIADTIKDMARSAEIAAQI